MNCFSFFIFWHVMGIQTKCPNLRLTESEPRDVAHIPFIKILGGVRMSSDGTGTNPVVRWEPNGRPGGRHLQCVKQKVERPNVSNKAHAGLTTVARQPRWGKWRALMNHNICMYVCVLPMTNPRVRGWGYQVILMLKKQTINMKIKLKSLT